MSAYGKSSSMQSMLEATRLTQQGRLQEALAMLRGGSSARGPRSSNEDVGDAIDGEFDVVEANDARFTTHRYANDHGARDYKLYVPATKRDAPMPLVVMLHGCTQSPDDFALGTRMNEVADEHGFLVAYPAQSKAANASKCWNWFKAGDQKRDRGEPSLIAGITRTVVREHGADSRRVYIAGLSAGGAAAAIMGAAYPDLYAAVGVHSGLAPGAARDMPGAFSAMKRGRSGRVSPLRVAVPTIVFHGDADRTVDVVNGAEVIDHARTEGLRRTLSNGVAGGVRYTKEQHLDTHGKAILEQWTLHGAGHAWSGGSARGSYADEGGPDASREMRRFFATHAL